MRETTYVGFLGRGRSFGSLRDRERHWTPGQRVCPLPIQAIMHRVMRRWGRFDLSGGFPVRLKLHIGGGNHCQILMWINILNQVEQSVDRDVKGF